MSFFYRFTTINRWCAERVIWAVPRGRYNQLERLLIAMTQWGQTLWMGRGTDPCPTLLI